MVYSWPTARFSYFTVSTMVAAAERGSSFLPSLPVAFVPISGIRSSPFPGMGQSRGLCTRTLQTFSSSAQGLFLFLRQFYFRLLCRRISFAPVVVAQKFYCFTEGHIRKVLQEGDGVAPLLLVVVVIPSTVFDDDVTWIKVRDSVWTGSKSVWITRSGTMGIITS